MATQDNYARHAFREIVARNDQGAGLLAVKFEFRLTGSELIGLSKKIPAVQPSAALTIPPTSKTALQTACLLHTVELGDDKKDIRVARPIQKDPYAIFATAAYIATAFPREIHVAASAESEELIQRRYTSQYFAHPYGSLRNDALEFYTTTLAEIGFAADERDLVEEYLFRICSIPAAAATLN